MATVLATWGEPENAEASLVRARVVSALGELAEVESVSVDRVTGGVDVTVRLPENFSESERNLDAARVAGKVLDLIANVFAEDDLALNRIHIVPAGLSEQDSPVRPRSRSSNPYPDARPAPT